MLTELNDIEARVIGCLIEKSIVTPDQYPLTLNALNSACNQKSSREPVMSLTQGEVQHAVRDLERKHLVRTDENFKSRVEKYTQRFCNTRYSDLQFSDAELTQLGLIKLAFDVGELLNPGKGIPILRRCQEYRSLERRAAPAATTDS